jgi:hypothetical protein
MIIAGGGDTELGLSKPHMASEVQAMLNKRKWQLPVQ